MFCVYESRRGLSGCRQVVSPGGVVDEGDGAREAIAFDDGEVCLGPGFVRELVEVAGSDVAQVLDAVDAELLAEHRHAMRELELEEELLEGVVFRLVAHVR